MLNAINWSPGSTVKTSRENKQESLQAKVSDFSVPSIFLIDLEPFKSSCFRHPHTHKFFQNIIKIIKNI